MRQEKDKERVKVRVSLVVMDSVITSLYWFGAGSQVWVQS